MTTDIHQAALAAYRAGLCPIPAANDGSKAPHPDGPQWQRYQHDRPDEAQLAAFFADDRYSGMGIVCGAVSGNVELLEFEGRAVEAGIWDDFLTACDESGLSDLIYNVIHGYAENTPSGGVHLLYRCDAVTGSTKLAQAVSGDVLIETKGEGGFVIVAPSNGTTHPSGKPWILYSGGFDSIVTISTDERQALHELAHSFDERLPQMWHVIAARTSEVSRPGDDFNQRGDIRPTLEAAGWTYVFTNRNGNEHWLRPGKRMGWSATWNENKRVLYVHSSSTPFPETPKGYSAFQAVAFLRFNGDFSAAARWLGEQGYGTDMSEEALDNYIKQVNERAQAQTPVIEWDNPIPLRVQPDLPRFPDESLPSWLGAFVRGVAQSTQTPIDLCAYTALASIAVAAGGRVVVEVRNGWIEPTNLWAVSALPPGARKSAVVALFSRPFFDYQREQRDPIRIEIVEKQALKRAAEAGLAQFIREIKRLTDKEGDDRATIDEATQAKQDEEIAARARLVDEIDIPVYPRLLADDATPEALASLMADQKGRIAVLSPEGDIFDIMAGRYSGEPNLGIYLRGHSGDTYQLDRKGRAPEYIERPALTLGLAVQPAVLREIGSRKNFRGRGLLARFLYSVPDDLVGHRDSNAPPLDAGVALAYEERMGALIKELAAWDDPMVLILTDEARSANTAFLDRIEKRLLPDGDLGSVSILKEWASKLVGQAVRLAGLLHVADHDDDAHRHPIELHTIQAAISIAERYCTAHARAAFDLMGQDEATVNAEAILGWIIREDITTFSKRKVHIAHRARFTKASEIDAPLALLDRHGWIAPTIEPVRAGAGRKPSPKFNVNPSAQNARITHNLDSVKTVHSVQREKGSEDD
jgi:hypothetical protein